MALAAFLEAGDAPIYMTFGSWMSNDIPTRPASCACSRTRPGWRGAAQLFKVRPGKTVASSLVISCCTFWPRRITLFFRIAALSCTMAARGPRNRPPGGQAIHCCRTHQRARTLGAGVASDGHRGQAGEKAKRYGGRSGAPDQARTERAGDECESERRSPRR